MKMTLDLDLAAEAKAMVALAFRNGPIEDLHAGRPCTVCSGNREISHISDEEMKTIMKSAVNTLYRLLWQRDCDPVAYNENLALGRRYTMHWDDPELKKNNQQRVTPEMTPSTGDTHVQRACSLPAAARRPADRHPH